MAANRAEAELKCAPEAASMHSSGTSSDHHDIKNSEAWKRRDEEFIRDVTGALLDPNFQKAMTALQPGPATEDYYWSWEAEEPSADEFTTRLETAIEKLKVDDPVAATSSNGTPGGEPDLGALIQSLGLDEGLREDQRSAIAAAPELVERLTCDLERALSQGRRTGQNEAECLSQ
mmetsp:Transcript_48688/g.137669  ORF Transcript_48688/g.137669 Transcript_48688/m.137669 type:complete len:175 (+) Transcript_48688:65-589(+)